MEFESTHLRASVQIDLCALERNLKRVKYFLAKEKSYIAFVPADAFGIGISAAVARLMESGADAFAVTNLEEALQVREIGLGWQIIVMTSSIQGEEKLYFDNNITANLSTLEEAKRFEEMGKTLNKTLKVNMRLPLEKANIPNNQEAKLLLHFLLKESKHLDLTSLCAIGTGSGAMEKNLNLDIEFLKYASNQLGTKKIYLHHSDIFDYSILPDNIYAAIRIGLILFGIMPEKGSILESFVPDQVLYFRTAISQVKTLPKGASVGYNNSYILEKETKVALISAGYGDGLTRRLIKPFSVLANGHYLPLIGMVSMDQACIDISNYPQIEETEEVVLIGKSCNKEIRIEDYCEAMGIVAAQALSSITKRVPRYYKTLTY